MDNLQTQAGNQTTGNPQSIGQSSLGAPRNNLQGSVGNQDQLLKSTNGSLQVTQCQTSCQTIGLQSAPTQHKSASLYALTGVLVVVLLVLVWRFVTVVRRIQKPTTTEVPPIEVHVKELSTKAISEKPKTNSKSKKSNRRKSKSKKR
ncbi:MAG TPA: hypothetical protein VLF39_03215 [Candidatus Saccharimonadales bacterium]|nr:hypothetical protein [Candidatus Saccharimonadales bacterium]